MLSQVQLKTNRLSMYTYCMHILSLQDLAFNPMLNLLKELLNPDLSILVSLKSTSSFCQAMVM